ncbi:protein of unknown function [Nocardioides exalbidus]|uniref:DUF1707 domain-containing protein n=1 Tax=Nocardioides exalbidus TaxID=402596 RepID=A0A1H4UGU5_9ACTN|nr:DUF1707 domain-containing protein [Nocardioides exalbidus]SEC67863.1 protein of unknown function [Nocardioides exalbidus]
MRGFRAKDSDRERYVDLIEAAYADGQLGDADRELRVGRALSAETLDELETLTRDLQRPGVPPPSPGTVPGQAPHAYVRSRSGRRPRPALIGLVVAGVALVVVGLVTTLVVVMSATVTSVSVDSGRATATAAPIEGTGAPAFAFTAASVRRFVRGYEDKFGTLEAYEVSFFPDRIQAQVPVRGSRPRMERWAWNGEWRQDTQAAAVAGPYQRVDLGAVDVRRLVANVATARKTLGVEKARFTHAVLIRWGDGPTEIDIYVGNDFGETAYLSSTPAGQVTRRIPSSA